MISAYDRTLGVFSDSGRFLGSFCELHHFALTRLLYADSRGGLSPAFALQISLASTIQLSWLLVRVKLPCGSTEANGSL